MSIHSDIVIVTVPDCGSTATTRRCPITVGARGCGEQPVHASVQSISVAASKRALMAPLVSQSRPCCRLCCICSPLLDQ